VKKNGNSTIFVLAESVFMAAETVTPNAPATSEFLTSASWSRRLLAALIRLAADGFDLNCRFLTIANRQNH